MARIPIALLLCAFFAACAEAPEDVVPRKDYEALRADHERLQAELEDVRTEDAALESQTSSSPVMLADTETHILDSAVNGQRYLIKVKFPRGYEPETAASNNVVYPVLYVTDAETNFGGVTYIVQRLVKDGLIPPILVVGVAYDTSYDDFYRLRSRDLTPAHDPDSRVGHGGAPDPTGGGPLFRRFFAEELFPFVESTYRADPNDRALYGHSYGGLFGSWVLLEHPELFRRFLLLSPSLWFKDRLLLYEARTVDLRFDGTRLYMGSGRLEPRIDDLHEDFIEILARRRPSGLEIRSEVLDDETHRTIFGRAFTNGLRFLYADAR